MSGSKLMDRAPMTTLINRRSNLEYYPQYSKRCVSTLRSKKTSILQHLVTSHTAKIAKRCCKSNHMKIRTSLGVLRIKLQAVATPKTAARFWWWSTLGKCTSLGTRWSAFCAFSVASTSFLVVRISTFCMTTSGRMLSVKLYSCWTSSPNSSWASKTPKTNQTQCTTSNKLWQTTWTVTF